VLTPPARDAVPPPRRPQPSEREQGRPVIGRARRVLLPLSVGLATIAATAALFGGGPVVAAAAGAAVEVLPRVVAAGCIAVRIVIANLDVVPLTPVDRHHGQGSAAWWRFAATTVPGRAPPLRAGVSIHGPDFV